jgi:hypothetical protein
VGVSQDLYNLTLSLQVVGVHDTETSIKALSYVVKEISRTSDVIHVVSMPLRGVHIRVADNVLAHSNPCDQMPFCHAKNPGFWLRSGDSRAMPLT